MKITLTPKEFREIVTSVLAVRYASAFPKPFGGAEPIPITYRLMNKCPDGEMDVEQIVKISHVEIEG